MLAARPNRRVIRRRDHEQESHGQQRGRPYGIPRGDAPRRDWGSKGRSDRLNRSPRRNMGRVVGYEHGILKLGCLPDA